MTAVALLLLFQQTTQTAKPMGTFDEPSPSKVFQSVGVHGNIDAGGYAASASTKTQTEFFDQLTSLQVASLRSLWASQETCGSLNTSQREAISYLSHSDYLAAARLLEKHPDQSSTTKILLGLAYEGLGQCGAAAQQFASGSPTEAEVFAQSVSWLLEGSPDRAEAVARQGSGTLNRLSMGAALFQRGETAQALTVFLDAASAHPAETSPFQFVAIAIRSSDRLGTDRAVKLLTSLSHQHPDNSAAHYALACALTASSGPQDVIEAELNEAIKLDPNLADAHFRLGAFFTERGDLPLAIAEYKSALAANPKLAEAHYRLSLLYTRTGKLQLAKQERTEHEQLRAQQKEDLQNGRIPLQFGDVACLKR